MLATDLMKDLAEVPCLESWVTYSAKTQNQPPFQGLQKSIVKSNPLNAFLGAPKKVQCTCEIASPLLQTLDNYRIFLQPAPGVSFLKAQ